MLDKTGGFRYLAQRMGFEPMVPLRGTHDFQSCSFDRSDISAYRMFAARSYRRFILWNTSGKLPVAFSTFFSLTFFAQFVNNFCAKNALSFISA